MAILSKPVWSVNSGECTTIEFIVIPGVFAEAGIVIEYVLHSKHVEYQSATRPPGLSDTEKRGSKPTLPDLEPDKRGRALLVDRYPGARFNRPLEITRALCLMKTPGGTPGASSITVTASDMRSSGAPTDSFVQSVTIEL